MTLPPKRRLPEPLPGDPQGKRLCELFNHPWYPIVAATPEDAQAKPQWQTLKRYPLRPRTLWNQWQDANQLVGVRFGNQTQYALIDLDTQSQYRLPDAISAIRQALETIGICRVIPIQSSWSGGVHLYLPLPEAVATFDLALAVKRCLEVQGFEVAPGQLEIFPNVKSWGNPAKGQYIQYNAHRLPLQPGTGSFLLDDDLQPIGTDLASFFQQWDSATPQQDLTLLQLALNQARANHKGNYQPPTASKVIDAWKQDLEREMAEGWTGHGQTNHLLKTIACYGIVFQSLTGTALVDYVEQTAIASAGYTEWCRHQLEIRQRSQDWAEAAERYYWELGTDGEREGNVHAANNIVPMRRNRRNQEKALDAQARIQQAVKTLAALGQLPDDLSKRGDAIVVQARCSKQTLYKYQELWQPKYDPQNLEASPDLVAAIAPPASVKTQNDSQMSVQAELEPVFTALTENPLDQPKPLEAKPVGVVHSIPYMKGGSFESNLLPAANPYPAALGEFSPASPPVSRSPEPPVIPDNADSEVTIAAIRGAIQQLGWQPTQFHQFVAERFRGRRWSQLTEDDRLLLLYWLRQWDSGGQ
ncbi:bifunctional DNA primase/polymerase [Pantanalinema rosaneae CENA516]|uniref:bifunctional DNA primase/polymerase n=1 Tax=Pantanalinema rosaneae TaxID=1620701 RepID=UPI003D6EEA32